MIEAWDSRLDIIDCHQLPYGRTTGGHRAAQYTDRTSKQMPMGCFVCTTLFRLFSCQALLEPELAVANIVRIRSLVANHDSRQW
jgi:hypothetical protein